MMFKEYVDLFGNKLYYEDDLKDDTYFLNDWDMTGYYNRYNTHYKIIHEIFDRPVGTKPVKNTKNVFITNYFDGDGVLYEFYADISGDLASISFYRKEDKETGAKKEKKIKISAIMGVLESVALLLKLRNDVKRIYFVAVDKDLERFNDSLIKWVSKKIKTIIFDKYEYDAKGRKCYWFRRT